MRAKTSVAIEENLLVELKREAARQDRSVSYLLNKMIEEKLSRVHENAPHYGNRTRKRSR
jgi:predicted DNA-binding ribbon-helix-helix protein